MLVATPGRLLDLIGQGYIDLSRVEFFVLDEADQMLIWALFETSKVLKLLPKRRQNLLFSATMPKSIAELASSFLHNAVMVDVSPEEITVDRIAQKIMFVRKADKRRLIVKIIKQEKVSKGIVFTRTKHGANRLSNNLLRAGLMQQQYTETKARVRELKHCEFQEWRDQNTGCDRYRESWY